MTMTGPARRARRADLALLVFSVLLAAPAPPAGATSAPDPVGLPVVLSTGWRAADGDPPDGVTGIDRLDFRPTDPLKDQAAREGVRWLSLIHIPSPRD